VPFQTSRLLDSPSGLFKQPVWRGHFITTRRSSKMTAL
jgi:hypothetical protein